MNAPHRQIWTDRSRPFTSPWAAEPEIVLDLSRLLSRVLHPTPTGVDRVEMAYATGLLRLAPQRLRFTAFHPCGLHGRLPTPAVVDFLELTAARWADQAWSESQAQRWIRAAKACLTLTPRLTLQATAQPRAYLHLSARSLDRRRRIEAVLRRERARFIPFVHDLIPLEHPEYARAGGAEAYRRKIATVTALADGVLVNSEATAKALSPRLAVAGSKAPVQVARLGAPPPKPAPQAMGRPSRPYFVALGTIEPRKNHLLLLHLWRRMVADIGPERTPVLVLVGRRGWENEMVLDLLDRASALRDVVHELGSAPDVALRTLIGGARAVLLPSFAEGYGLPVAEALAQGTPVIASDLPALREAGGAAPDYLDPLDGPAWAAAIDDYATPGSPRRQAQLARIAHWRRPTWDEHLHTALVFIAEVCA